MHSVHILIAFKSTSRAPSVSKIPTRTKVTPMLKSSNFASHDKSESMLNMLINVGPWVLIGFLACLFMTFFEQFSINREITVLKQLIASNHFKIVLFSASLRHAFRKTSPCRVFIEYPYGLNVAYI